MKNYLEEFVLHYIDQLKNDLYTCLPGEVVSFDEEDGTATVRPMIKINGDELPELDNVVIHQQGSKDYLVEIEIKEGTEGMIYFSMRPFANWFFTGQLSDEETDLKFDINDSFFVPGIRSVNTRPAPMENNGIKLRNNSGDSYLWLKNDGNVYCSGDVYSKGEKLTRQSHTHKFTGDEGYKGVTEEAQE